MTTNCTPTAAATIIPIPTLSVRHKVGRLRKEIIWIGAGSALVVLGNLFGLRFSTELLEPEEFGRLAIGMAIAGVGSQIFFGPIQQGISRFLSVAIEAGELARYWAVLIRMLFVIALPMTLMAGAIQCCTRMGWLGEWTALITASVLYMIISGIGTIMDGVQTAARHRLSCAAHQAGDVWLRYICGFAVVRLWHSTATVIILGFCIGSGLVLISQMYLIRGYMREPSSCAAMPAARVHRHWSSAILRYSWPFMCWGIFGAFYQASDRWALEIHASSSVVGLYSVVFQLGYLPPTLAGSILMQLVYPIVYATAGDGGDTARLTKARHQTLIAMWIIGITITVGAILCFRFHALVFALFVSSRFQEYSHLLPFMFLASGLFAIGQMATLDILAGARSRSLLPVKIAHAVAGTALNFVFVSRWGVSGLVASQVLANGMYTLTLILQTRLFFTGATISV